jgi:hypothetical protein
MRTFGTCWRSVSDPDTAHDAYPQVGAGAVAAVHIRIAGESTLAKGDKTESSRQGISFRMSVRKPSRSTLGTFTISTTLKH